MTGQKTKEDTPLTCDEFSARIVAMMQTLYRISYTQLSQRCDRDEAVQECLLKAWQKREQLRDVRFMQTWVIRILINECHNIQRRQGRELPLDELPERAAPPGADAELHDALFSLDETLRLPLVLCYVEGFSTVEIARMLRCPQGTVKSRMRRGRQALKKILTEEVQAPCGI
jgi:RNA polymerase sigma-70 factor (ECF subfamily)